MNDSQYEDYKKLKAAREYSDWMDKSRLNQQRKLESQYQKDIENNIEVMRNNGTLIMGVM